ncbi:MAG: PQQ-binding-like beta-propeller repeat protein [Candidatus Bathyarchaeota archaeon]|nr:PQQ-binding-like beta-propeller repeat protein [Candidatus Bathyarchaeota archaeon]
MQFSNSKTTATYVTLFLVLTIAASLTLPIVDAHTPAWSIPTYAYITVQPDPVGVDQTLTIVYWLDKYPPTAAGIAGDRWRNLQIEVTKPDGSKETLGPYTSDPVGGGWATYTPTQVGTYTFVFIFPGQVLSQTGPSGLLGSASDYTNDTYLASNATATVTVLADPIADPPSYPLPSEYWTRPIEGQNTEWYKISSNWLSGSHIVGKFQPDGTAPSSAHVMWTKPLLFGGVVGGTNTGGDGMTFYDGSQYENKFTDPIILYGRLYYTLPKSDAATGGGYVCVNLYTGETIWWQNYTTVRPSFGQIYTYESMNQHGAIPNGYLWATTTTSGVTSWQAFDPLDGNWLFTETNVPSGTTLYGPNGEILIYQLNVAGKWLAVWNNTAAQALTGATSSTDTTSSSFYQWRPVGKTVNASNAYSWNVTIPELPTGTTIRKVIYDDLVLCSSGSFGGVSATNTGYTMYAISLKPTSRGQLLWQRDYAAPSGNLTRSFGPIDPSVRVFTMFDKETIQWTGYSLDDGSLVWGPTASENPWNFYTGAGGALMTSTAGYGKLFSTGYSGIVYCYDLATGKLLWNYTANSGLATPYGGYPLGISGIADGKIYLSTNEHSSGAPYWKGAKIRCLNVTTGDELWTLAAHGASSYGSYGYAIADGYLVYLNVYDNQIYCIGKGPSATTVTASPEISVHGNSVLVKGTVTDIAAGAKQLEQAARFPNGLPAISDENMGEWMEYVYMQKPCPANAKGVDVSLDALDPNGNFVHIGTVTSDLSGLYSHMFTPEVPGKYTIIATFAGSDSYYGSYAETAIGVDEAPPATAPPEYPQPIDNTMTIIGAAIAIIIAVAVATLVILRKK